MPVSNIASSTGSEELAGFTKRASRVISNAGLIQLIEDIARKLDTDLPQIYRMMNLVIGTELPEINRKLDKVLEKLDGG